MSATYQPIEEALSQRCNELADCRNKLDRLLQQRAELLAALQRILRAHDSGNNGAYMGEAILCRMFAEQARAAIANATKPSGASGDAT